MKYALVRFCLLYENFGEKFDAFGRLTKIESHLPFYQLEFKQSKFLMKFFSNVMCAKIFKKKKNEEYFQSFHKQMFYII